MRRQSYNVFTYTCSNVLWKATVVGHVFRRHSRIFHYTMMFFFKGRAEYERHTYFFFDVHTIYLFYCHLDPVGYFVFTGLIRTLNLFSPLIFHERFLNLNYKNIENYLYFPLMMYSATLVITL